MSPQVGIVRERRLPVAFALVLLLAVPLFAGCLGGKKGNANAETDKGFEFVPPPVEEVPNETKEDKTDLFTPKAHFHHYWGEGAGVPMVVIFDSNPNGMEFQQFPLDEHKNNYNSPIGYVEFNLETDGDDVTSGEGDSPTNALTGRADAVFAGTSHLIVNISWDTNGERALVHTGDFRFQFQPACAPILQPADNAGIPIVDNPADSEGVVRANPIRIPVSPRCADPPHQIAVSRWSFLITSYPNDSTSTVNSVFPNPPSLAKGFINVKIEAQNGGANAIGPPHPDLFNGSSELQLGPPVEGTFKLKLGGEQPEVRLATGQVVSQKQCVRLGDSFGDLDVQLPTRYIVPFQTQQLIVTVTLAYDAAANNNFPEANAGAVRLLYHPANHTRYTPAPGYSADGATQTYTFTFDKDKDLSMTDPVYNVDSDWRFGFTLLTNDQPCLGTWAGSYTLSAKAIRNPEITIF